MNVTQISIGRFHHFHLARQMEKRGLLNSIYTGYPRFKLRDEVGIPVQKIRVFPWIQAPYMARNRVGLGDWKWLGREMAWIGCETLDQYVASNIKQATTVVALSGSGLRAGTAAQREGGKYICDRGSSHIRFQDEILKEEYERWGLKFGGIDQRIIEKEEKEYERSDKITVPSEFVRKTFLEKGVPAAKLCKVPYGARLDRFQKVADPIKNTFRVLWVGGITLRKGFLYLIEAFNALKHPRKELYVIGALQPEMKKMLHHYNLENVHFKGLVHNSKLPEIYSSAHVFVLPSLEEGLAMVQGEAMSCGCPVIATSHTGSEDLFADGKEGFVVPLRSPLSIAECLQRMADDELLRQEMSVAAMQRVKLMGGWDSYGAEFSKIIHEL